LENEIERTFSNVTNYKTNKCNSQRDKIKNNYTLHVISGEKTTNQQTLDYETKLRV